jgi:DNA processing protein
VVKSDLRKGGTWAGASEQLEKLRFVRVYVRSTGKLGNGLEALQRAGAEPWPNPVDAPGLEAALTAPAAGRKGEEQGELPLANVAARA